MSIYIRNVLCCLILINLSSPIFAQNTGGVIPPFVNEGSRSLHTRIAIDPDNAQGERSIATRLHYLHSFNDDLKGVLFMGSRQTAESDFDFDYLHAGVFIDLGKNGQKFRNGVRFDLRVRDGSRPNHVGALWLGQYYFDNGWTARMNVLSSVQIGDRANDGLNLQTRWQLANRLESGDSIGLEMYSFYGSTDNLGNFDSQNHSVGPMYTKSINTNWSLFSSLLIGVSESAPDTQVRFWLIRAL
jgi:hypothetical protein